VPPTEEIPRRTPRNYARFRAAGPIILFFLVLAAFFPCIGNGFVNFDDPSYASQNPHVKEGLSWASIKWAWSNTESSNWHPVTWMSHLLDGQLFGLNPAGHHATSILLHAINTLLLFFLLNKMTRAWWRSILVAAFFGLHPLRVESVAWIAERKDVLGVTFWMLSMCAYVSYAQGLGTKDGAAWRLYILSLVLFALGLMAKSMLVTLPFALLLLDYWPLKRWPGRSAARLVAEKLPFFLLSALDSLITYRVQKTSGSVTPADVLPLTARMANAVVSYARYLGKIIWPADLGAMYVHPGHWPIATIALASALLVLVTAVCLWRRDMPYLAMGWFWFLGTLLPVIGIVQVGRQAIADRYTYLPSIGFFIAIVWGGSRVLEKSRFRELFLRFAVPSAIMILMILTARQIGFWKSSSALWQRTMAVTQRNWVAAAYLGSDLEEQGRTEEAVAAYRTSLDFNPNRGEVRRRLGRMLLKQGHVEEGLAEYRRAIELDPEDLDSRKELAASLQNRGRLDDAIAVYAGIIQLKPEEADVYSDLGNCYGMKGRPDEAVRCLRKAVELKPNSAQNHRELGVGLANLKNWDEALQEFQRAVQLDPADAQARQYLAAAGQMKSLPAKPATPQ